jgi:hypothetical protein
VENKEVVLPQGDGALERSIANNIRQAAHGKLGALSEPEILFLRAIAVLDGKAPHKTLHKALAHDLKGGWFETTLNNLVQKELVFLEGDKYVLDNYTGICLYDAMPTRTRRRLEHRVGKSKQEKTEFSEENSVDQYIAGLGF